MLCVERASIDTFAAALAIVAFVVLRRFTIPTYWLVPIGAVAGMCWVLLGMR